MVIFLEPKSNMTVYNLLRTLNVFRSDGEHSPLSAASDYANGIEKLLFLFQRISVSLFRFNSVLLHKSSELDDRPAH